MSIKNIITFLILLGKPKRNPVTVSIEITPELYNLCTLYNVTPERVINDFINQISNKESQQTDSEANESIVEYLNRAYGNLQKVGLQTMQKHRIAYRNARKPQPFRAGMVIYTLSGRVPPAVSLGSQ